MIFFWGEGDSPQRHKEEKTGRRGEFFTTKAQRTQRRKDGETGRKGDGESP